MPRIEQEPGDTMRDTFNRSLYCGELPTDRPFLGGCGARDWRVFSNALLPPWARILVCQRCGRKTFVEIESLKTNIKRKTRQTYLRD